MSSPLHEDLLADIADEMEDFQAIDESAFAVMRVCAPGRSHGAGPDARVLLRRVAARLRRGMPAP